MGKRKPSQVKNKLIQEKISQHGRAGKQGLIYSRAKAGPNPWEGQTTRSYHSKLDNKKSTKLDKKVVEEGEYYGNNVEMNGFKTDKNYHNDSMESYRWNPLEDFKAHLAGSSTIDSGAGTTNAGHGQYKSTKSWNNKHHSPYIEERSKAEKLDTVINRVNPFAVKTTFKIKSYDN